MKNKYGAVLCVLILCCSAFIQAAEKSLYNPKPLPDDLILPMPNGAEMVFRPVLVSGTNFWGETDRIVTLGDAQAGMFSNIQKNMVNGSFPSKDGKHWVIWIAKYELTTGQFVAVMGRDALAKYSGDSKDGNYSSLQGKKLKKAQVLPLAWVSYTTINKFIEQYNNWLFDSEHPERVAKLPSINGVPGFIRLPTEEEWEFSARGGLPAIKNNTFNAEFPFPEKELKKYAWFKDNAKRGKKGIGYRKPNVLGIHDMYGNVSEMVQGVFRPEMTQGKPGGITVRGGSFRSSKLDAKVAIRREMDIYKWNSETNTMTEGKTFTIGTRLAIGSNVLPTAEYLAIIKDDYEKYKKGIRQSTPAGLSVQNLAGQAVAQLGDIDDVLKRIIKKYPDTMRDISSIQQNMDKARSQLDQAQHKGARSLVQDATRNAVNILELLRKEKILQDGLRSAHNYLQNALDDEEKNGLTPEESGSDTYRKMISDFSEKLKENPPAVELQYNGYLDRITEIKGYAEQYQQSAFATMGKKSLTQIESRALALVNKHVAEFNKSQQLARDTWWNDIQQAFDHYVQEYLQGETQ